MEQNTTTGQRMIAWIGIVLLVLLVIATVITAAFYSDSHLFPALLLADIAIPIIFFIWIETAKWVKKNRNQAVMEGMASDKKKEE